MKTQRIGLIWIALLIIMAFVIMLFARCSSTKDLNKTTEKVNESREKELSDSLHLITSERDKLESEIKELQYAGVIFKTDTINHRDTITNTIEITKEGAIKATGNIGSAYVSKSFVARIITEKDRLIDSFRNVKQKEKYITRTVTITKTKYKKTSFFPLWLILIAFVAGWIVKKKLGSKSFKLFNKIITI